MGYLNHCTLVLALKALEGATFPTAAAIGAANFGGPESLEDVEAYWLRFINKQGVGCDFQPNIAG